VPVRLRRRGPTPPSRRPRPTCRARRRRHSPGTATVTDVDLAQGRIELDHGPIPSMKWPSMTMAFGVDHAGELASIRKGDRVEFEFRGKPNRDGDYIVTRITPMKRPLR
jgi:Cu(I)/Ag(I) efflux system membrane fusion protein